MRLLLFFLFLWSSIALGQGNFPIGKTPTVIVSALTLGASGTSPYFYIGGISNLDCQLVWTGTPAGNFTLSTSEDTTTWDSYAGVTAIPGGGGAGHASFGVANITAPYAELVWTKSSSTGTLTSMTCFGKVRQ